MRSADRRETRTYENNGACCLACDDFARISQADDFSSLLDARKFTDQIIELFQEEKIAEAYESMKPEENTLSHRTSLFVQLDFHQLAPLSADVEY